MDANYPVVAEVLQSIRALPMKSGDDLLDEVIELFVTGTVSTLRAIGASVKANDGSNLAHLAHQLKGSAVTLGAQHMTRICDALEAKGRREEFSGVEDLLSSLEREFVRVRAVLEIDWMTTAG